MALVLEEVVVKDQLMRLLHQLDFSDVTEEGELLEALQTKGATDPHYRVLCAHLASEFASWVEFLAGNDLPSPVHIPTDTAETFAQALVPLLRKEGAHKLVERFGLNGDAPLQTFTQKADLLEYFLGELLACRLMGYKRSKYQNPSVSAEKSGDLSKQFGGCIKTAFAVLKIEHVPETGEKAVRAIEEKIIQLNKTLPESYNRPLFDLSSLSPEQLSRLEQVNDGFKTEYSKRQAMIVDRFRQTLIPLFRVKGVPVEIKEGLQSNINEELAKHQKSHSCDFSTWDIVVARDDLIRQQMQRTSMRSLDDKGSEPRMKSLVVNVEVSRKGAGGRVVNKKEELPKRSRRRRKWEADDADSLPTGIDVEAGGEEEEREGEPLPEEEGTGKKEGGGEEEEGEEEEGELTREEKAERRRLTNERREMGEKRKADELLKKKTQEPKELSKQDKQFLKQQLKKEKRQQRREKKLEKTRRGQTNNRSDDEAD
ncbi:uncharacterized protein ACA1_360980 [Acanthamoeba castellanii str. Neff]|uniref:Uncharacterized protein n=1 Tax=Acanthamoeba castellanii (strain ATCC 30010 / Neff) TaxID=1257118 RepID=L8HCW0_ACACF|nr:uncharacterized protein ACA1_360980 [Acanthamoeba castellanii str. Neff]ELR23062.1 hypothetical protein ACA1_360980 [Acanthamoeba castellanii str. Neff]